MGVMACSRKGCENIMCNHYNREYGYICWECLKELEHVCGIHGLRADVIDEFMRTPKRGAIAPGDNVYDVFKEVG